VSDKDVIDSTPRSANDLLTRSMLAVAVAITHFS
jgi:hypothetical protein